MAIFDYVILFAVIFFVFLIRDHIVALIKDLILSVLLYAGVIFMLGALSVKLPIYVEVNGLFICIAVFTVLHFVMNKASPSNSIRS